MKCILHLEPGGHHGDIKPFDDTTWQRVIECDFYRREHFKQSKFFAIVLPEARSEDTGYRVNCYKSFTAVHKSGHSTQRVYARRSSRDGRDSEAASSSGISLTGLFPKKCIFCELVIKRSGTTREQLVGCETEEAQSTVTKSAETLEDEALLTKIRGVDFVAKEVKYHNSCRRAYNRKAERKDKKPTAPSDTEYVAHEKAFYLLRQHIDSTIVEAKSAEKLVSLHKRYIQYLGATESNYDARSLRIKIEKVYGDTLQTHKDSNRTGSIIYHCSLSPDEAWRHANLDINSVHAVATYLRKLILQMTAVADNLPENISAASLNAGEGFRPDDLTSFISVLYTGSTIPINDKTERLVNSTSDDIIYAVTRGRVKPGKHLTIGVALKSMTGSRKVIDVLNRFGHCVSYHTVESIETDLATNISARNYMTPDGIQRLPGLCTGLAWDNYDECSESLSGSDSLHDTVGICYQNKPQELVPSSSNDVNAPEAHPTSVWKKSKRTFTLKECNIEPYRKKPKITVFTFATKEVPRPHSMTAIEYRDILWAISLSCQETPMWVG